MKHNTISKTTNLSDSTQTLKLPMPSTIPQPILKSVETRAVDQINIRKFSSISAEHDENQSLFQGNSGRSSPSSSHIELNESRITKLEEELSSLARLVEKLTKDNIKAHEGHQEIQTELKLELNVTKLKNQELEGKLATQQHMIEELISQNNQLMQKIDAFTIGATVINQKFTDLERENTQLKSEVISIEQRQNQSISFLFDQMKHAHKVAFKTNQCTNHGEIIPIPDGFDREHCSFFTASCGNYYGDWTQDVIPAFTACSSMVMPYEGNCGWKGGAYGVWATKPVMTESEIDAKKAEFRLTI